LSKNNFNYVTSVFPEILEISDENIQKKVAEVWMRCLARSKYSKIEDVPNFPSKDYPAPGLSHPEMTKFTLIDHVRSVVYLAKDIAKCIKKFYDVETNLDYLIAGAIIHDADKVLYYSGSKDSCQISDLGKYLPHGFMVGSIAWQVGIDEEIVNIALTHAGKSAVFPQTIEGLILIYADIMMADTLRKISGAKGILESYKNFGPLFTAHM